MNEIDDISTSDYVVTMSDGTRWKVPVIHIAMNRAEYFAYEFNNDVTRSLNEDTLPLFRADTFEIHDWAANNMDWCDVIDVARRVADTQDSEADYDDGWMNGTWDII